MTRNKETARRTGWIAGVGPVGPLVLALGILCGATSSARELSGAQAGSAAAAPDSRHEMIATLAAPGPHPSLGEEARLFDRFVGTWDCAYSFHAEDGSVTHSSGELKFGWILDGWAIQDIWIGYPTEGSKGERRIGTSVRFFDTKSKVWRVVFVAPAAGSLITVQGGLEGDRIVLRGQDSDGSLLRWSFNDIHADSFVWRGETSRDQGKTWRLEEEHHMMRRRSR